MKKQLKVGRSAPQFSTEDVLGHTINLKEYADKAVLLVFLRYSGCPWCNLAIHRLTLEHKLLMNQNCQVITFIQSTTQNVIDNIYGRHAVRPPFPIIADPNRTFYDLYGVGTSVLAAARSITKIPYWVHAVRKHGWRQTKIDGNLFLVPAMFLLAPGSQKVLTEVHGTSFYDHDTFTNIYQPLIFDATS